MTNLVPAIEYPPALVGIGFEGMSRNVPRACDAVFAEQRQNAW